MTKNDYSVFGIDKYLSKANKASFCQISSKIKYTQTRETSMLFRNRQCFFISYYFHYWILNFFCVKLQPMKQIQKTGFALFPKYSTILAVSNMIYQLLHANTTLCASQPNGEVNNTAACVERTPQELNLQIVGNDGTSRGLCSRHCPLSILIFSYHNLAAELTKEPIRLKPDYKYSNFVGQDFDLIKLLEIGDVPTFCSTLAECISTSIQPRFGLLHSSASSNSETKQIAGCDSRTIEIKQNNFGLYMSLYNLVYSWVYKNAVSRCCFTSQKPENKNNDNFISKTVEDIFEFIFMINPTSREYMWNLSFCQHELLGDVCESFELMTRTKNHIFLNDEFIKGMKVDSLKDTELMKWLWSTNNKEISKIIPDYLKFLQKLRETILEVPLVFDVKDYQLYFENLWQMSNCLHETLTRIKSTKEHAFLDRDEKNVEYCLSSLETFQRYFKELKATYEKYLQIFQEMDGVMKCCFNESIQKALHKNLNMMEDVCWIKELMLFQPYVFESAVIIESKSAAGISVAEIIVETLNDEGFSHFPIFFGKYNQCFPVLLKSICDNKPESWDHNIELPSLDSIILKIKHQECRINDLMDLYYAAKKANLDKDTIERLVNVLLVRLSEKGVQNFSNIQEKSKQEAIIMLYAINILRFSKSVSPSNENDIPAKLREVITFATNLEKHIQEAISDSETPFLEIITEDEENSKNCSFVELRQRECYSEACFLDRDENEDN